MAKHKIGSFNFGHNAVKPKRASKSKKAKNRRGGRRGGSFGS